MAADSVLQALEDLISSYRGTGEPLAVFVSVNNSSVQAGEEGKFPYLLLSSGSQRLILNAAASKLHSVPITISVYGNSRQATRTAMQTLKNTIEPVLDDVPVLSELVTSDSVQIYAAEEVDTTASRVADRVWVSRWNLEFGTRTVK